MARFHIKSILLGVGIGVVLTTLTGIIYSAGMEPQMSKEEIMAKARQYGMVSNNEIIEQGEPDGKMQAEPAKEPEDSENKQVEPAYDLENNEDMQDKSATEPENTGNAQAQSTANPGDTENMQAKPTEATEIVEKRKVQISIAPGDNPNDVAKQLVENGLIDDPKIFVNEIKSLNLQRSMQVGKYTIEEGTDIQTIIKIICKRKKI